MKTILLINGPNLNMLGTREPDIYGTTALAEVESMVSNEAAKSGLRIESFQSNHEGAIIDFIQEQYKNADGIIINPGALTHYSYSLRDCLAGADVTTVEVHISDISKREEWRQQSVIRDVCAHMVSGEGINGYLLALEYIRNR